MIQSRSLAFVGEKRRPRVGGGMDTRILPSQAHHPALCPSPFPLPSAAGFRWRQGMPQEEGTCGCEVGPEQRQTLASPGLYPHLYSPSILQRGKPGNGDAGLHPIPSQSCELGGVAAKTPKAVACSPALKPPQACLFSGAPNKGSPPPPSTLRSQARPGWASGRPFRAPGVGARSPGPRLGVGLPPAPPARLARL